MHKLQDHCRARTRPSQLFSTVSNKHPDTDLWVLADDGVWVSDDLGQGRGLGRLDLNGEWDSDDHR